MSYKSKFFFFLSLKNSVKNHAIVFFLIVLIKKSLNQSIGKKLGFALTRFSSIFITEIPNALINNFHRAVFIFY